MKPPDHAKVTVHFFDQVQTELIDLHLTVKETKRTLQHLIGLAPSKFRLFHNDVAAPFDAEELKIPSRPLHVIPIRDGDELHLEAK